MTLRFYYRDNDGDVVEITNPSRIRRTGTEASYQAEEGAVGTWELEVDDPEGTFNVRGFRILYAQEDEAVADNQHGIIGVWYTGDRSVSRLSNTAPAKRTGAGRTWRIQLHDLNTRLSWRINVGNDCDRTGIDETDLETVAWLMGTNEMGSWLDSDTTYIDTDDGFDMSENRNYTGQTLLDVLDDCAQTSGRNYGLLWEYSGNPSDPIAIKLWYKFGTSEEYTSSKFINNAIGDKLGSEDIHLPSLDATLHRSPSRVASGVYQQYDGGAIYETLAATAERFNKIDVIGKGENVKSAASAQRRAQRYLNTVSDRETDRLDFSVLVTPEDVNSILPFHRLPVWFSHLPGYAELDDEYLTPDYAYLRVMERTVRDEAPGIYELGLTLMAPARDDFPESEGGGVVDTSWIARVEGSSGPYPLPSGPLLWDKQWPDSGITPGWFTVGPFDYVDSGRSWPPFLGIEITDDCVLAAIHMRATAIGVMLGANEPYTVVWELLQNGTPIAEATTGEVFVPGVGGSAAWSGGPVLTAVNVTASAGDVISGRLTCTGAGGKAMEMFRSPLGINAGQNFIVIKGGYLL